MDLVCNIAANCNQFVKLMWKVNCTEKEAYSSNTCLKWVLIYFDESMPSHHFNLKQISVYIVVLWCERITKLNEMIDMTKLMKNKSCDKDMRWNTQSNFPMHILWLIVPTTLPTKFKEGYTGLTLPVCLWMESGPLCIFHNTLMCCMCLSLYTHICLCFNYHLFVNWNPFW